jgi:hypothetical protein
MKKRKTKVKWKKKYGSEEKNKKIRKESNFIISTCILFRELLIPGQKTE